MILQESAFLSWNRLALNVDVPLLFQKYWIGMFETVCVSVKRKQPNDAKYKILAGKT
jgi:hypothetical protein